MSAWRALLIASLFLGAASGSSLTGCGGASASDLFAPATETGPSDPTDLPSRPPSTQVEPAEPETPPSIEPPTDPPSKCAPEVEPNDRGAQATKFLSCLTGTLKQGDVDIGAIVAPPNATAMTVSHSEKGGEVQYQVFAGNRPLAAFTDEAPVMGVKPGEIYLFRMLPASLDGDGERQYQVTVTFE